MNGINSNITQNAGVFTGAYAKIAEKPVGEYKYTVMLGSIDKSEEEKKDFR